VAFGDLANLWSSRPATRARSSLASGSSNPFQQAAPLSGVEPLKGFVKEFDRVRLLLGHNNRVAEFAEETHRAKSGPVKVRAAKPRYHPYGPLARGMAALPSGRHREGASPPVAP
jgi:hypothetical protein